MDSRRQFINERHNANLAAWIAASSRYARALSAREMSLAVENVSRRDTLGRKKERKM